MERTHEYIHDRRAARAAHSLYRNRQRLEEIQHRVDRASIQLLATLALSEAGHAVFGGYEVALDDEQTLTVTLLPNPDARQLPLPEQLDTDDPIEFTSEQLALLDKAAAGNLPCPWCSAALKGTPYLLAAEPTVHLSCPDPHCGFEEI